MNSYEYYGKELLSDVHEYLSSTLRKEYIKKLNREFSKFGVNIHSIQEHQWGLTKDLSILKDPIKYGAALDYIQRMDKSYLYRLMEHMRNNNLIKHAADICHKVDPMVLVLSIGLEEVPLFINSHLPKIRAIAEWRLRTGK